MNSSPEHMRQKIDRTKDLHAVVHTMKALAAANIGQFEQSVRAMEEYFQTLLLGLSVCLQNRRIPPASTENENELNLTIVIFGSDQGLVGPFNELMIKFVVKKLKGFDKKKIKILAVGERIDLLLKENRLEAAELFKTPGSIHAITPLVGQLLMKAREGALYVFHNKLVGPASYEQIMHRVLPLDERWIQEVKKESWITGKKPEVIGEQEQTLKALIREYLFATLFKTCAESLAAENTSRLSAMQRAEKNIEETLVELEQTYHLVRQNAIDEELFDIISGFEALKDKN